jgi:RNAse (barnase) inhibitor barstar
MWNGNQIPDNLESHCRLVRVPVGLRSKEKLLGIFAKTLEFPGYFGWNWDAFEECLRDLSWLPDNVTIVVVHEALPFGESENREIYLSILNAWRASSQRNVQLILLEANR